MEKETLEDAMESYLDSPLPHSYKRAVEFGAKWQQERSYSEEEVIFFIKEALNYSSLHYNRVSVDDWFEQFKKK
jgi:hypothetical protein